MKTRYCEDPKNLYQKCFEKDEKRILQEESNYQPERLSEKTQICEHCKYPKRSPYKMIVTCSCNY